jgi:hypothetical protein
MEGRNRGREDGKKRRPTLKVKVVFFGKKKKTKLSVLEFLDLSLLRYSLFIFE